MGDDFRYDLALAHDWLDHNVMVCGDRVVGLDFGLVSENDHGIFITSIAA